LLQQHIISGQREIHATSHEETFVKTDPKAVFVFVSSHLPQKMVR
jgi:hypothetical protein